MSRSTVSSRLGPIPDAERSPAPDLARGFALVLVALANSAIYLYGREYGARQHIIEHDPLDRAIGFANTVVAEGRGYPLFAALFGYGIVRAYGRHRHTGVDAAASGRIVRRRHFWLIAFGAVHAVVLFSGDILGLYGLMGLILTAMLKVRDKTLITVGVAWLGVALLVQGIVYSDPGPNSTRGFFWSFTVDDPLIAAGLRGAEWLMTPFGLFSVFSAALAGMWAARHGILDDPVRHRTLLRRTAIIGVGFGLAGGVPVALVVAEVWIPTTFVVQYGISALHVITGVACGLGYAAAIGLLAARARRGRLLTAISACGQRSLSCYLLQSLVFVALFAPYTLGLGGRLGSAATAGVALAVWLAGVVFADLLRRRGSRGPAEVLLRSLTYHRGPVT